MNRIVVLGSINFDLSIEVDKLPALGETVSGRGFVGNSGGKGANQAVAAAKLGGNVCLVGAVGEDFFGTQCTKSLFAQGVNIQHIKQCQCSTGVAIITLEQGDNRIILEHGANYMVTQEYSVAAASLAQKGDIFLSQMEIPPYSVLEALKLAKQRGAITILNPAPAKEVTDEIISNTDIIIPNETEATILTGVQEFDIEGLKKCQDIFQTKGVKEVIITLGSKGCYYQGQIYPADTLDKVVDTTAAGDTFVGALAVMLSQGHTIAESIDFCQKACVITISRKGAQMSMPTYSEVQKIL